MLGDLVRELSDFEGLDGKMRDLSGRIDTAAASLQSISKGLETADKAISEARQSYQESLSVGNKLSMDTALDNLHKLIRSREEFQLELQKVSQILDEINRDRESLRQVVYERQAQAKKLVEAASAEAQASDRLAGQIGGLLGNLNRARGMFDSLQSKIKSSTSKKAG